MRNRRIVHDMADRPGTAFVRANSRTLALTPARFRASSTHPKTSQPNGRGTEMLLERSNVAELKIHMGGRPMLFRFVLDDVSTKTLLDTFASQASIHSPLRSGRGEIVDQNRESTSERTRSLFRSTPTIAKMGPETEAVAAPPASQTVLRVGPLDLDLLDRTAKRGERKIDLRPREFRLLQYMMERSDKILSRGSLLRDVWNYKFVPQTNLVDVHMGRLRRKVDGPNEPAMIRSVRGAGFILNTSPLS